VGKWYGARRSDGSQGLEKVFREEFANAKVQRCIVIIKAPKTMRQEVADSLRDIFYAIDRKTGTGRYYDFVKKYDALIASAVASLKRSIQSCLTFYDFPEEEWVSLRTTNIVERVNKEFKR